MKNTTPILVLTGLAIAAAVGIAGLTREQWMGQPTPAVATTDPATPPASDAPAASQPPATPEAPAATSEAPAATAEAPAATGETAAPAAPAAQTAAVEAPEQPAATAEGQQTAAAQPETTEPAAEPAPNAAPKAEVPAFDTVRIEKTGEAVIAGRAQAGSEVVVKLNGEEIGKTVANSDGAFVLVPEKPLPAGSGAITIEATGKGDLQPLTSEQSVAVIVPEGAPQGALVAVVSPDAPTKVLQKPEPPAEEPAPAAPAAEQPVAEPAPAKLVSIDAVDYDPTGNIVFSGQGEKGNTARIYVDNQFLGDAPVGEDGRWSFSGTADVAQGVHTLRVDGLDAKGNVLNRVEVPFFREEQTKVAEATEPAAPAAEQPAAEQPAATAQSQEPAQQPETAAGEAAPAAEETAGQPPATAEQPVEAAAPEQPAAGEPAAAEAPEQPASDQPASTEVAKTPEPAPAQDTEQDTMQQSEQTTAATAASEGTEAAGAEGSKEGRIVIQPGNNLWRISRVLYGTGSKFTMLYEANKDQIRNPNLIYPGQVFRTPDVTPKAETIDPKRRQPLAPDENAATAQ